MNKQRTKQFQYGIIAALAIAVLTMAVGFAAYSQNLQINGTANVAANKWSVHFVPGSVQMTEASSVKTPVPVIDSENTTVTFTASLAEQGDSFEFTVNAINDGTFDANLTKITMTPLTTEQDKYLEYTVTYGGTVYTATSGVIAVPLAANGGTETVAVKVKFKENVPAEDLPETGATVTLNASLDYNQQV